MGIDKKEGGGVFEGGGGVDTLMQTMTLAYRQFCGSIIKTYKNCTICMTPTVPIHSLNLKESNTCGHKFSVKTKLSRTSIRQTFFSLQIANL